MKKCWEAWTLDNGNINGLCCCNCTHLKTIHKHPWNKNDFTKGKVTEIMGYGCSVPEVNEDNGIIFFESQHGCCEMHSAKNNKTTIDIKI